MKRTLFLLAIALGSQTVSAQDWFTDFSEAKEMAARQEKTLILVFQGSDWCAPCIKLDRAVWSTEAFKAYAADHYVMLQADFPRKKANRLPAAQSEANAKLAEIYNPSGIFPFVVVLDSDGAVLGVTSYKNSSPEEYIAELNAFIN